jgi:hypothetical protein
MNDTKFKRLFLGFLIGAGFLILIGTIGTGWYGMERPATRLGELSKVVSLGGSLIMLISFGFYVNRTRHSRRAMQAGPFNATEGVRVMSGMLLLFLFSPTVFEALPNAMRPNSFTIPFNVGYLVWLSMVVLAALECMRRFGRARLSFVLGLCALILSFAYVTASCDFQLVWPSFLSFAVDIYRAFQFCSFLVFLAFFQYRGLIILKHQRAEAVLGVTAA